MKNKIIAIQTLLILLFLFSNVESYSNNRIIQIAVGQKEFKVNYESNDKYLFNVAPRIINGRLMIEAKKIFNNSVINGAEIRYFDKTKTATIMLDEPAVYYNGSEKSLLLRLISEAKKSIDIQMYRLQDVEMINAINQASKKEKVKIRIILDKSTFNCEYGGNIETALENNNLEIRWKSTGAIMHRKLAVIDGETIILGSTNWTDNAFTKNWEITLIMNNKEESINITDIYNEDWEFHTDKEYCKFKQ